jgi:hypothetical protein
MSDISSPFSDRFDAAFLTEVDFADLDLGVKTRVLLDRVADRLGAEEHALLLLRRSVRTIRGHNSTCLHLIFMFCEAYADLLRATGWARFDGKLKCWYLPEEFVTEGLLAETFSGRFTHIVDLDEGLVWTTGAAPPAPPLPYLELLPAPITFSQDDVISAFLRARPQDVPGGKGRMGLFDEGQFSHMPEGPVATRYPLVLLRFPVEGGHPRYVTFSPLSGEVERVSFYNESGRAIARQHDVIRSHKAPVLEPVKEDRKASLERVSGLIREELAPFLQAADRVSEILPDADLSVLHGAYLELLDGEGNRDANRVHGKVRVLSTPHLTGMARALGHTGAREVVVHPASFEGVEPEMRLITLVHELAHHLVNETCGGPLEEPHGILWAVICAALLAPFEAGGDISLDQIEDEFVPYLSRMGRKDGDEIVVALSGDELFADTIRDGSLFTCENLIRTLLSTEPADVTREGLSASEGSS